MFITHILQIIFADFVALCSDLKLSSIFYSCNQITGDLQPVPHSSLCAPISVPCALFHIHIFNRTSDYNKITTAYMCINLSGPAALVSQ